MDQEILTLTLRSGSERELPISWHATMCQNCGHPIRSSQRDRSGLCECCVLGSALETEAWEEYPLEPPLPPSPTTSWLGPYALIEEIGRGGMGVIYRAIDHVTGQEVAVKTVLAEYAQCSDTLARFQREAEAAQKICHPYSMPVIEVGHAPQGLPYFSMPLATGGSLHNLREKYRGRWRQIAELLIKVTGAVHHAHQMGILHRDLKPGNILFTEDHEPLIIDFGLAKHLVEPGNLTYSRAVLGTPNYVAPEQASGKSHEASASADIYSLGAIFFELLTGRPPFVGENALDVLRQAAEQLPPKPRSLAPSVPKDLETICLHCLERNPQARYKSAEKFATDLGRWLDGRKIVASPLRSRWRYFISKRVWIHRILLACLLLWFAASFLRSQSDATARVPIAIAFENLDQDASLDALARQATHELQGSLAARTSELPNEEANGAHPLIEGFDPLVYGRAHNAELVLAGSLHRSGQQVRLNERLLRCSTGETVGHRAINLPEQNAQNDLSRWAQGLSGDIRRQISADAERTVRSSRVPSPEAQAFYTRAIELTARDNPHDLDDAVTLLRRAAKLDPTFTTARATLAYALWTQAEEYGQVEKLPLAISTAREALAIDPHCAQAHRVIASCYFKTARNDEAYSEFWKAVESDPHSAGCCTSLGMYLRAAGQLDGAIAWMTRSVQLEPSRSPLYAILGETLALRGSETQAESALRRAVELDGDLPEPQFGLIAMRVWRQDYDVARTECAQVRLRFPQNRYGLALSGWIELCAGHQSVATDLFKTLDAEGSYQRNWKFYGAINPSSALAYLAFKAGSAQESELLAEEALATDREILLRFPRNPRILHDMAATCAIEGDRAQAFRLLEEAISAGWIEFSSTRIDPRFSQIAGSDRFKALISSHLATHR